MKHARKAGLLLLLLTLGHATSSEKDKETIEGESFHSEFSAEKLTHDKFDTLEGAAWHDLKFSMNEAERKDKKSPEDEVT
jgi:hypothetical protein